MRKPIILALLGGVVLAGGISAVSADPILDRAPAIAGEDQTTLTQDQYALIDRKNPSELVKLGNNYYYRRNVKIYPENSKYGKKVKNQDKHLSQTEKHTDKLSTENAKWLNAWRSKTPEQKTLIEFHDRYGFYLSNLLGCSDVYCGSVGMDYPHHINPEFMDSMMKLWEKAGLSDDSLTILYDKIYAYFAKREYSTKGPDKLYLDWKIMIRSRGIDTRKNTMFT